MGGLDGSVRGGVLPPYLLTLALPYDLTILQSHLALRRTHSDKCRSAREIGCAGSWHRHLRARRRSGRPADPLKAVCRKYDAPAQPSRQRARAENRAGARRAPGASGRGRGAGAGRQFGARRHDGRRSEDQVRGAALPLPDGHQWPVQVAGGRADACARAGKDGPRYRPRARASCALVIRDRPAMPRFVASP
jgi:hypothetical protein